MLFDCQVEGTFFVGNFSALWKAKQAALMCLRSLEDVRLGSIKRLRAPARKIAMKDFHRENPPIWRQQDVKTWETEDGRWTIELQEID